MRNIVDFRKFVRSPLRDIELLYNFQTKEGNYKCNVVPEPLPPNIKMKKIINTKNNRNFGYFEYNYFQHLFTQKSITNNKYQYNLLITLDKML